LSSRFRHCADSGVSSYDSNRFLLPPPSTSHAVSDSNGVGALLQTGHSRLDCQATQEVVSIIPHHALLFFPDGWAANHKVIGESGALEGDATRRCFALRAGEKVRWITPPTRARVIHLHIPGDVLNSLDGSLDLSKPSRWIAPGARDDALALAFYEDLVNRQLNSPLALQSYAALLAHLLSVSGESKGDRALSPWERDSVYRRGDWRLRRAIEYLEARIAEPVSLAELAAQVDLSQSHLVAVFRSGAGEPPHRWLMLRRIERACQMLAETRLSITEIALACGFASSQHFATTFRKHKGATPSDYRRGRLA
jgi:AraC family transcriptional regulator